MYLLHVKDGRIALNEFELAAVGSGEMNVLVILAAARSALRVAELDEFVGDTFPALTESFVYLTSQGVRA